MNLRNLFLQPKITYTIVKNPDKISLKKQFANSWKNPEIVPKQYSLTVKQRQNKTELPAVKALISDLKKISRPGSKILEIGCSTGYHSDYFKEAGLKVSYEGCDFSPAFIAKAKELHPDMSFKVSDATALDYKTGQFEVVISGCCILHILDYEKAIAETARVAKKNVIFHRTPILHLTKTTYTTKTAYNTPMVEIFFNETKLIDLFKKFGLVVVGVQTTGKFNLPELPEPVFMKNYLCAKRSF